MEITAARRNPGRSAAEYNFKKTSSLKSWAIHGSQKAGVQSPSPSEQAEDKDKTRRDVKVKDTQKTGKETRPLRSRRSDEVWGEMR